MNFTLTLIARRPTSMQPVSYLGGGKSGDSSGIVPVFKYLPFKSASRGYSTVRDPGLGEHDVSVAYHIHDT